MVQTRWTHLNRNYSFLTQVEAILLDGHFVLEHARARAPACSSTSTAPPACGAARPSNEAGGWQHDTLTEDTDLSYRAQLKGWKFVYLQDVECPAEVPIEMTAFKTQQARWAKGLIQTAKKILPRVLRADVPLRTKIEAWYHLTANISYPLMIVLSVAAVARMIIRFYQGWFQMLYIDLPLFLASTFSISSFYLVSQKELYPGAGRAPSSSALPDGARHRTHGHQHDRCAGSPVRHPQPLHAHPLMPRPESAANHRKAHLNITSASASSPSSNSSSAAISSSASGTRSPMRITSPSPSCCCSSSAISIPACSRSSRDASSAGVPALTSTTPPPSPSLWASEPTQNYKAPKTRKARGPGQARPTARSLDSFHPLSLFSCRDSNLSTAPSPNLKLRCPTRLTRPWLLPNHVNRNPDPQLLPAPVRRVHPRIELKRERKGPIPQRKPQDLRFRNQAAAHPRLLLGKRDHLAPGTLARFHASSGATPCRTIAVCTSARLTVPAIDLART